ncbi:MAG TPA: hypothetical protein VK809_02820 [Bacteroidia bacterium]|jgi:hypothetical protein|nr:hypothetical protein [Bacteroidia bacterium]
MKRDTIFIALAIGLAVFLMRWFRAFTPIENYQIHFLPLFGIYFGMRMHFKKLKMADDDYPITFIRTFWLGLQMSLLAAVFTGLLCLLFVSYSADTIRMFSPLHLHSFPFTSTAAYGILVSILCSAIIVYFKPIKIKHDTNFHLHSKQFLY